MRGEVLPFHPEAHVGTQLAPQEFAEVPRQVRRRDTDARGGGGFGGGGGSSDGGGVLGVEAGDDADLAADTEGVVLGVEVPRPLEHLPPDEHVEAPVRGGGGEAGDGVGLGLGRHRLAGAVEQGDAELREDRGAVGRGVLEDEEERDEVGILLGVPVGEVGKVPGVAADAEGAGPEVDAGGEALGARVAVDLEHVRAGSGVGDDGGGRRRRPGHGRGRGRHCGRAGDGKGTRWMEWNGIATDREGLGGCESQAFPLKKGVRIGYCCVLCLFAFAHRPPGAAWCFIAASSAWCFAHRLPPGAACVHAMRTL